MTNFTPEQLEANNDWLERPRFTDSLGFGSVGTEDIMSLVGTVQTITVTWNPMHHPAYPELTADRKPATATFIVGGDFQHFDMLEGLFEATNLYSGVLWDALEEVMPTDRDHTALSIGDEVTIGDATYRCQPIGWEAVA